METVEAYFSSAVFWGFQIRAILTVTFLMFHFLKKNNNKILLKLILEIVKKRKRGLLLLYLPCPPKKIQVGLRDMVVPFVNLPPPVRQP